MTIARIGAGTQRVEAELSELLAPLEIFRLDSDSAAGGRHAEVLPRFERAPTGVLVGPRWSPRARLPRRHPERDPRRRRRPAAAGLPLGGADLRPDHPARRPQRTGEAAGRVLVQALATGAPSIRHAARHDAAGFLAEELERRRALRYPPFSHLIEVALSSEDEERADSAAERMRRADRPSDSGRIRTCSAGAAVPRPWAPPPPPSPQVGAPPRGGRGRPRVRGRSRRAVASSATWRSRWTWTRSRPGYATRVPSADAAGLDSEP